MQKGLKMNIFISIFAGILFFSLSHAADTVTGFQVATWGMDRSKIIEYAGKPDYINDVDGSIDYFKGKFFAGFPVTISYKFERGCKASKTANCSFLWGHLSFEDNTQSKIDKITALLEKKYGKFHQKKTMRKLMGFNEEKKFVHMGTGATTTNIWSVGKVTIVQGYTIVKTPYTEHNFGNRKHYSIGDYHGHSVHYYGPNYYEPNR